MGNRKRLYLGTGYVPQYRFSRAEEREGFPPGYKGGKFSLGILFHPFRRRGWRGGGLSGTVPHFGGIPGSSPLFLRIFAINLGWRTAIDSPKLGREFWVRQVSKSNLAGSTRGNFGHFRCKFEGVVSKGIPVYLDTFGRRDLRTKPLLGGTLYPGDQKARRGSESPGLGDPGGVSLNTSV